MRRAPTFEQRAGPKYPLQVELNWLGVHGILRLPRQLEVHVRPHVQSVRCAVVLAANQAAIKANWELRRGAVRCSDPNPSTQRAPAFALPAATCVRLAQLGAFMMDTPDACVVRTMTGMVLTLQDSADVALLLTGKVVATIGEAVVTSARELQQSVLKVEKEREKARQEAAEKAAEKAAAAEGRRRQRAVTRSMY